MFRTGHIVRNSTTGARVASGITRKLGVLAAAVAFTGLAHSASAQNDLLYDWRAVNAGTTPVSGFVPAPFVTNASVGSVAPTLPGLQASFPGRVAVKVTEPLTPANITTIFGGNSVNYAFYDLEGANAAQFPAQATATKTASPNIFVGNFRMFPGSGDTSGPTAGPTLADYVASGANMANEDLYPGSPFYKNPGQTGGSATSPNIRSALFTLPIERASYVSANLPAGHKHIPYVNRFNNVGNAALQNQGNTFVADAAHGTAGQLLSRGDFSALVAHYRARGANGVHLLDGGVVGYTQAQFEQDAKDGFQFAPFANIFNGGGAKVATLDTVSKVDGQLRDNEATGVVFSGVYSLTQNKLALLVSNLDAISHSIDFDNKIGNKTVVASSADRQINAGSHKLLEFTGSGTQWNLTSATYVFVDTNRDGVGVPEPMALGGASLFALTMLCRRRRTR
jgi:hypothetical protein